MDFDQLHGFWNSFLPPVPDLSEMVQNLPDNIAPEQLVEQIHLNYNLQILHFLFMNFLYIFFLAGFVYLIISIATAMNTSKL